MNSILLDGAGNVDEVFIDHRHKSHMVPRSERFEKLIEGLDVVGAVVRGQRNSSQQDLDVRGFEGTENLFEVAARLFERQTAKTIVAAELDDDDFRVKAKDCGKTRDGVFGGGSAGALIDDLEVVALGVELALQGVGE